MPAEVIISIARQKAHTYQGGLAAGGSAREPRRLPPQAAELVSALSFALLPTERFPQFTIRNSAIPTKNNFSEESDNA